MLRVEWNFGAARARASSAKPPVQSPQPTVEGTTHQSRRARLRYSRRVAILTKREFIDRLLVAGGAVRTLALSLGSEALPEKLVFTLRWESPARADGRVTFLGGRIIAPDQLVRLGAAKAGGLLWVDGRIPAWVNLTVCGKSDAATEIEARFTDHLMAADPLALPRDYREATDRPIAPFRVRGPSQEELTRL